MGELLMWLSARLLGTRYVRLIDKHEGDETIAPIRFRGGVPMAERHPYGIAVVRLHDNGVTSGVLYVDRWEPYEPKPFGPRSYPRFNAA